MCGRGAGRTIQPVFPGDNFKYCGKSKKKKKFTSVILFNFHNVLTLELMRFVLEGTRELFFGSSPPRHILVINAAKPSLNLQRCNLCLPLLGLRVITRYDELQRAGRIRSSHCCLYYQHSFPPIFSSDRSPTCSGKFNWIWWISTVGKKKVPHFYLVFEILPLLPGGLIAH